jgi:hypothetical protein
MEPLGAMRYAYCTLQQMADSGRFAPLPKNPKSTTNYNALF